MRALLAVVLVLAFSTIVIGQGYGTGSNPNSHFVNPYVTGQGTYVPGHYQTNPNSTQFDNYGTRGNYNPYSGKTGTRSFRY